MAGKYLIEFAIMKAVRAGIHEIVINVSYQAEQIKAALGDGQRYGAAIVYSDEPVRLETGGGVLQALPLLGDQPFLVMSSDVVTDYPLTLLPRQLKGLAHLVLVGNPDFYPQGDFGLREGYLDREAKPAYTYANIGVYHPALFEACEVHCFPLSQVLFPAIKRQLLTGEHYDGVWHNVGTPSAWMAVNQLLADFPQLVGCD